jgi:hypothetical protein
VIITKLTDNFYELTDVLSLSTVRALLLLVSQSTNHNILNGLTGKRDEVNIDANTLFARTIAFELSQLTTQIELLLGKKLYANSPSIWSDHIGYQNGMHVDQSTNLSVNVQIYLNDSAGDIGTYCYDDHAWHTATFGINRGYCLIGPTKITHGMKSAVVDSRISLYQSYRDTLIASSEW